MGQVGDVSMAAPFATCSLTARPRAGPRSCPPLFQCKKPRSWRATPLFLLPFQFLCSTLDDNALAHIMYDRPDAKRLVCFAYAYTENNTQT